jgi:hypothetical protein
MEASSPFDDVEDDEDEDEDGDEDLVEEEAPIDWSAIDANAFFQNWLLPGGMGEQQEQQPQSQQQMAPANFGASMLPQQMYTPNGSVAPADHVLYNHQQQSQQQQQEQQTQSGPAASPNLSAAIEILTKVLGEGQEVPSQVLEMLLQSVAPTLGYQPPTPSQEPGIDSLVPILKDLIKKQQQQEQQQMQNESARGGSSIGDGGNQSWSSVIPHPRTSAVGPSPMPNVSYSSMTPQNQPFSWVPLATPADDDEEDDEDKDPSYNPTMLTGALGIQDALQEQMSQYLNSPFAVTPTGATSNRPSPLPQPMSLPPSHSAAATTSVRSSPRKAQAVHRRPSAGSGVGKQSAATTARTGINAAGPVSPSPASESQLGPRAEARLKASKDVRNENEAGPFRGARGGVGTGSKSKKRSRADTYDSEEERRQPVREISRDDPDGTPPRHGMARERNKPRASNASSRRGARGHIEQEEEGDDLSLSPSRSPSASRSSPNGRADSPTPSPVKKPSNAGRKPIFDTEEERKAQRAKQNRLYQQEYRARKRAEKDVTADRRAGASAAAPASATGKGKTSAAGSTAGQGKGHNTSNGNSKSAPKSASSATALEDAARLREEYGDLREENAELKAEQRLLRAEMERLRRENVELRVEVEVSRRLALGSSKSSAAQGGTRVLSRNRGSAGGAARRAHRRSELEQEDEEDAHSSDQEGSARSEDLSDSEPDDRDVGGSSRRRGDGRPSSKTVERRAGGNSHPARARDRERDRDRDRGAGRAHASSRGYR